MPEEEPCRQLARKAASFPSRERQRAVRRRPRHSSPEAHSILPLDHFMFNHMKTCSSCKCPRESHDVYHEEWVNVRERLGLASQGDQERRGAGRGYAWVPPGLNQYKVEQYFRSLPSEKVPRLGTPGEKYREKQLMVQLPKQDLALAYCRHVEPGQAASFEDFITARNEIALDIAYAKECMNRVMCPHCEKMVLAGDVGVMAPKFSDKILYHPGCFACSTCQNLLVDLTYCFYDDLLYCERHYAEQLKPRCAACDEQIYENCEVLVEDQAKIKFTVGRTVSR